MVDQEIAASVQRARELGKTRDYANKKERAAALMALPGHPLNTLRRENDALELLLSAARERLAAGEDTADLLKQLRGLSVHYAKKGDLLYPLLKTRYEIAGPSDLMWTEDDEIRDELAALCRAERGEDWAARLDAVLKRAQEMVFKENNIFFPICAVNLSEEEWRGIYRDETDYGSCLGIARYPWEGAGETAAAETLPETAGEIVMPGGHLTREQLIALLNTIPMEITFVDAQDINRFFNEGPKVFKRPGMALDRDVFSCHPPKIEPMVRAILEDFRAGKRNRVPVWTEKGGRTMLVTYLAVRDREGTYLGTVELVQDMEFAREHFTK